MRQKCLMREPYECDKNDLYDKNVSCGPHRCDKNDLCDKNASHKDYTNATKMTHATKMSPEGLHKCDENISYDKNDSHSALHMYHNAHGAADNTIPRSMNPTLCDPQV